MLLLQDAPKQRQPNIKIAKKELGWTPKVNLEDGLKNHYLFKKKLDV